MAKYGDPYSELVLCIYPSKVHTHSSEHTNTHTVNTHTEQWAAIFVAAPGEHLGAMIYLHVIMHNLLLLYF